MRVRELVVLLQACDPEAWAVVRGYEGGVNDVGSVRPMNIAVDDHDYMLRYYGRHEETDRPDGSARWDDDEPIEVAQAVQVCGSPNAPGPRKTGT